MNEGIVIPIAAMSMVVLLSLGVPFVRALARRWERESMQPKVPSEVAARLERIEHAVEAVAIEVERISEGQRFTTKLLSERTGQGASPASGSAVNR
jgi:hypothetical protein